MQYKGQVAVSNLDTNAFGRCRCHIHHAVSRVNHAVGLVEDVPLKRDDTLMTSCCR